ncbi:hypothetical protein M5D96_008043, partial [Drosophila gunungcola]
MKLARAPGRDYLKKDLCIPKKAKQAFLKETVALHVFPHTEKNWIRSRNILKSELETY